MAGIADLIIAAGQFAAVDSVIRAMRAVDMQGGANPILQPTPDRSVGSDCYRPADRYEPQRVIHSDSSYAARPGNPVAVARSVPIEKRKPVCAVNVIVVQPTPVANEQPLQPPWAVLPWENPVQTAPKVKVVYRPPDINHRAGGMEYRGTALDLFI